MTGYEGAVRILRAALVEYARATDTVNPEQFAEEALAAVDVVLDGFGTVGDAEGQLP